jgi:5'-nucleotidase (lipoprotein e(P4) family)
MHISSRFVRQGSIITTAVFAIALLGSQLATNRPTQQQEWTLYADLWMQTSAECEALCLQTYQLAGDQIERELKKIVNDEQPSSSASHGLPPAVILDLDETTIDNGTYETFLYDSGQDFTPANFNQFVTDHKSSIRMVPGAKEFIERMESLGVTVMYNTNRPESLRKITIETLAQWGINTKGMGDPATCRLLLQTKEASKEARRSAVAAKYRVLALFGDQLIDFSDEFIPPAVNTLKARREAVHKNRQLFGKLWFVLPNPVYGNWQNFVKDNPMQYLLRAD